MRDEEKTRAQLLEELVALRQRVAELEASAQPCQPSDQSLCQIKVELEQIVAERTAALKGSNDHLIAEVAERQQIENELRAARDQLETVLEAVPGIVSWVSSDLRYLGVNRHLAEMFNMPPEAFVGQDIGFLQTSGEFNQFVRSFFASSNQEAGQEVSAHLQDEVRNYLVVAQKYNHNQAAFVIGIDITERYQAEEALREAEAKYRNIYENAIEGIFQTSPDGTYLDANPALARIYGYESAQDLMATLQTAERLYVDPNRRREFVELLREQGSVLNFESEIYRRDGTRTWISENARAVYDEQGHLLHYEGMVEEIAERKQAETALQQANEALETRVEERTAALLASNQRLRVEIAERQRVEAALRTSEAELKALFAAMSDAIAVFDGEGRYLKIVPTNSNLLHHSESDRVGKTIDEVLPPETAALVLEHIRLALETQQTVSLEYSLPMHKLFPADLADASLESDWLDDMWFAANVSPMPDGRVIWVARDITQRKQTEKALFESQRMLSTLMSNLPGMAYRCLNDAHWTMQFVSEGCYDLTGYQPEALVGNSNLAYADLIHPDDKKLVWECVQAALEAQCPFQMVYRIVTANQAQKWVWEQGRGIYTDDSELLLLEGFISDITERKRAEMALQVEQQESERLLLNILPAPIAKQLKQSPQSIAQRFEEATILFADIVDFTGFSAQISPTELVDLLNQIFSTFDYLAEWHRVEKIKTIGDAYMVVAGVPTPKEDHLEAIAEMALDMQEAIACFHREDGAPFMLRIGINTGPVVAGVIGVKKFIYDLWGDTVNVASRMEAQGMSGCIQVTDAVYSQLKDKYEFEQRGAIFVKGRGEMTTYWLKGRKDGDRPTKPMSVP
jgi:PAS domain S-box-containing protein